MKTILVALAAFLTGCASSGPLPEDEAVNEKRHCVYQRVSQLNGYIICYGSPAPFPRVGD